MEQFNHASFNTVHCTNERQSHNSQSGAITTDGGIGVGKNIYVNKEVNSNDLIARENLRVGDSAYICNDLHVGNLCHCDSSNKHNYLFKKNIVPNEKNRYNLGENCKRWYNMYSTNCYSHKLCGSVLDVDGDISLGTRSNSDNKPLIKIDPHQPDTVIFNSNILAISKDGLIFMGYDQENDMLSVGQSLQVEHNCVGINNLKTNYININSFLSVVPQVIVVDKDVKDIKIKSSLIFLILDRTGNLHIKACKSMKKHTIIKIVVKSICLELKNPHITLYVNEVECVDFKKKGDYAEVYYDGTFFDIITCVN